MLQAQLFRLCRKFLYTWIALYHYWNRRNIIRTSWNSVRHGNINNIRQYLHAGRQRSWTVVKVAVFTLGLLLLKNYSTILLARHTPGLCNDDVTLCNGVSSLVCVLFKLFVYNVIDYLQAVLVLDNSKSLQ